LDAHRLGSAAPTAHRCAVGLAAGRDPHPATPGARLPVAGILPPTGRADRHAGIVTGVDPARSIASPTGRQPLGLGAGVAGPMTVEALIQPVAATTAHTVWGLDVHSAHRLQFGDETVDHAGRRRAAE